MKACLILLALVAGSLAQSQFTLAPEPLCTSNWFVCTFKSLGNQIKGTLTNVGQALKTTGQGLITQLAKKGADLVQLSASALAKTVTNSVDKLAVPEFGKRSLDMKEFLGGVMDKLKDGYGKAIDGLMEVAHKLSTYQLSEGDIHQDISDIVDEFKSLAHETHIARRSIFEDFSNQVSTWKNQIGDFLKPHVDNVVNGVTNLGNTLKGHATNLLDTLKGHAATLGDKLKEHASTLKGHAQTAVQQLQSAVADILKQTAANVGATVGDAVADATSTGKDAAATGAAALGDAAADAASIVG